MSDWCGGLRSRADLGMTVSDVLRDSGNGGRACHSLEEETWAKEIKEGP